MKDPTWMFHKHEWLLAVMAGAAIWLYKGSHEERKSEKYYSIEHTGIITKQLIPEICEEDAEWICRKHHYLPNWFYDWLRTEECFGGDVHRPGRFDSWSSMTEAKAYVHKHFASMGYLASEEQDSRYSRLVFRMGLDLLRENFREDYQLHCRQPAVPEDILIRTALDSVEANPRFWSLNVSREELYHYSQSRWKQPGVLSRRALLNLIMMTFEDQCFYFMKELNYTLTEECASALNEHRMPPEITFSSPNRQDLEHRTGIPIAGITYSLSCLLVLLSVAATGETHNRRKKAEERESRAIRQLQETLESSFLRENLQKELSAKYGPNEATTILEKLQQRVDKFHAKNLQADASDTAWEDEERRRLARSHTIRWVWIMRGVAVVWFGWNCVLLGLDGEQTSTLLSSLCLVCLAFVLTYVCLSKGKHHVGSGSIAQPLLPKS